MSVVVVVVVVVMQAIGGFHVTSSPACWWTVNKRSLISSFCLSKSIVYFTIVICVSRDCMKTTYGVCKSFFPSFFFLSKRIFGEFVFSQHLNMDFTIFLNVILSDLSKRSLSFKTKT